MIAHCVPPAFSATARTGWSNVKRKVTLPRLRVPQLRRRVRAPGDERRRVIAHVARPHRAVVPDVRPDALAVIAVPQRRVMILRAREQQIALAVVLDERQRALVALEQDRPHRVARRGVAIARARRRASACASVVARSRVVQGLRRRRDGSCFHRVSSSTPRRDGSRRGAKNTRAMPTATATTAARGDGFEYRARRASASGYYDATASRDGRAGATYETSRRDGGEATRRTRRRDAARFDTASARGVTTFDARTCEAIEFVPIDAWSAG